MTRKQRRAQEKAQEKQRKAERWESKEKERQCSQGIDIGSKWPYELTIAQK